MKDYTDNLSTAETARLLKALASLIEKSNPDEISALLRGKATLTISHKGRGVIQDKINSPVDIESLAKRLEMLESRESGENLLASAELPRRELERLGRLLGISVLKTDNVERLTAKIIENSIGSRLNSVAIRGSEVDS
jgi:hypothetical protein